MKYISRLIVLNLFFFMSLFAANDVLSPEDAFDVSMKRSGDVVAVKIGLGKDIYIYDEQLKVSVTKPKEINLDEQISRPEAIDYDGFMVHKKPMTLMVPISLIKKHISSGDFTLQVAYQGCSATGICYQPMTYEEDFTLKAASQDTQASAQEDVSEQDVSEQDVSEQDVSEQDAIASMFKDKSIFLVLAAFFGFGLLLSFTPCVFPMIPILSSIIVSQNNERMTTKRAFLLSLVYVLAMALAYTIAGVLAGLFGANIQAAFQNPWIISVFAAIFVLLAFSMFGFYELQMPNFIQSRITRKSDQMQGQGVFGVAVMGFLSALIVGPCVAAPLAGALIYIGQSGDAFLGGAALFVMSLGMGFPLLLIGTSASKFMPKPGKWMDNIKAVFGVVMLALAVWMLSRILDGQIIMLMWAVLAISSAVYLGALEPLKEEGTGYSKLIKSIGVILLVYGVILFIGAMNKNTNPLNPLANMGANGSAMQQQAKGPVFTKIKNEKALEEAIANSKKPVLLDFYADWCISCIELEEYTFSDAKVQAKMEQDFTLLKVDVTKNTQEDKALLKRFGLFGPPAILFFQGEEELKNKRIVGFKNATEFLTHLKSI